MIKLATTPPTTLLLAAFLASGVLALLLTVLPTQMWVQDGPTPLSPLKRMEIPNFSPRTFESYAVIAERPLFNPGHVPDPSPVVAANQIPALDNYRLVGIVLAGDVKLALVERKSVKQVVTLHTGDALDGRHVDDITEAGIALSGTGTTEFLAMPKPTQGGWSMVAPSQ